MKEISIQDGSEVSVVIPTVGEKTLENVIRALNEGSYIPTEIIICIPNKKADSVKHLVSENTRILATEVRGQVKQRIEGFKAAKSEYVMQMDSDIVITRTGLAALLAAITKLGKETAVCPVYDNGDSRAGTTTTKGIRLFFKKVLNLIIDNRLTIPPGSITKAGVQTWPPFTEGDTFYAQSEWLPGGCVLHRKENLILEDFYPFLGKAYGEDVIHSIILRKKNIKLFICKNASIINEGAVNETYSSFLDLMIFLKKTKNYRHRIVELIGGSYPRLWIWLLYFYTVNILRFYRSRISKHKF